MTDERQAGVLFESWLKDTDPMSPDARPSVAQVMTRLPQTRQRGRWWPLPALRRKPNTPTINDMTVYQPSPFPAIHGHVPIVIGRTQTMFSPVKAIIAGALVFALGGMFLIAQPFSQQGSVPGTVTDAPSPSAADAEDGIEATHVTGTTSGNRTVHMAAFTHTDDFSHNTSTGGVYERDVEWSDPRLPSTMRLSENWDFYSVGESDGVNGAISLVQNVRLDGPDGSWTGAAYGLLEEMTPVETYPQTVLMVLEGNGAYEGFSAMFRTVYDEPPAAGEPVNWEGYILEGPMTPLPEAPESPAE